MLKYWIDLLSVPATNEHFLIFWTYRFRSDELKKARSWCFIKIHKSSPVFRLNCPVVAWTLWLSLLIQNKYPALDTIWLMMWYTDTPHCCRHSPALLPLHRGECDCVVRAQGGAQVRGGQPEELQGGQGTSGQQGPPVNEVLQSLALSHHGKLTWNWVFNAKIIRDGWL